MKTRSFLAVLTLAWTPLIPAAAPTASAPSVALGRELFQQRGSNSCAFCHGPEGRDGNVKNAARLDQPTTWKSHRATGGDPARLTAALTSLITHGSLTFNAVYREAGFDWTKIEKVDLQMLGLTGTPSQAWLERRAPEGVTPALAAESLLLYLRTLDREGFWSRAK